MKNLWRQFKKQELSLTKAFLIFCIAPYILSFIVFPISLGIISAVWGLGMKMVIFIILCLMVLLTVYEFYVIKLLWKQSKSAANKALCVLFRILLIFIAILLLFTLVVLHAAM